MAERLASNPAAWFGQALLYALFALIVGVFSQWPPYRHLDPGQALIKVSFSHTGKPVGDCVRRSVEELAKLPPQMRKAVDCPRERSPVSIEVDIGGAQWPVRYIGIDAPAAGEPCAAEAASAS